MRILWLTERWVAVDKPSGLAVHRPEDRRDGDRTFVVQQVRDLVGRYVWPVHRLDRGTSGALLLCFDPGDVATGQAALAEGHKVYVAVVRGAVPTRDAVVVDSLLLHRDQLQTAHTRVRPLAHNDHPRCSLVQAEPSTGRYHQIRRHLRDLSHPVLGDGTHGDSRVNRWWREERGLHRLALHCAVLDLPLPEGAVRIVADVPDDLQRPFEGLGLWEHHRVDAAPGPGHGGPGGAVGA